MDAGLRAAGDHRRRRRRGGSSPTPRRSRGRRSRRPTTVAKFGPIIPNADRDLAGADVRDAHRDEERADPVRPAQGVDRDAVDERADAAEAGPEDDAGPLGLVALEPARQAGLVHRLARRDEAELDVAVRSAACPCGRGRRSRRSRGPRRRSWRRPARGRTTRPARRRTGRRPSPAQVDGDVVAERGQHPHPGDDDAARRRRHSPLAVAVIGRASRSGPWRPGRRRRAGRGPRSRWRRPSCRTRSAGSRPGTSVPSISTSAHDAVGSPSKT